MNYKITCRKIPFCHKIQCRFMEFEESCICRKYGPRFVFRFHKAIKETKNSTEAPKSVQILYSFSWWNP